MDDRLLVGGRDLDGRVRAAGRRPADEQRQVESLPLHLAGNVRHLVQARRDEPAQADHVDALLLRLVENLVAGAHHPQIDHVEIVARQHHAHDVLADVVDVALDRGHEDLALRAAVLRGLRGLLGLHERHQVGDGLLHHARALDHLRQEHLPRAEQVADHAHARHQRPLDDLQRPGELPARLLGVGVDEVRDALDQRVGKPLLRRAVPPRFLLLGGLGLVAGLLRLDGLGGFHQPLGGVLAAVEQHVLHPLQQVLGDVLVHRQHARVDDAHVHAGADRVVEERGVHRLADGGVAAEGKRDVRHPAADVGPGQVGANPARGLDEIDRVVVVLLDAGGDREDVGIEDDVLGGEADLFGQDAIGAGADFDPALVAGGLAFLVEGHHHGRRAVPADELRVMLELRLALLERDAVDDPLALQALQSRLDDAPLGGIDHDGHARDVRFGGQEVKKAHHGLLAVEHALVHVHVEDVRASLNLLARDLEGGLVVAREDELGEARRAGDVGALADEQEVGAGSGSGDGHGGCWL